MQSKHLDSIRDQLGKSNYDKLASVQHEGIHQFIADYVQLCQPDSIWVCDDSDEDAAHVRQLAVRHGEEIPLALAGQTIHFDGYDDQARDKDHTLFLFPEGQQADEFLPGIPKSQGLPEIRELLAGSMKGHTLYVRFFCLGPTHSDFSISCVQLTDSAYVAHSEDLLYRRGYEELKRQGPDAPFFRFVHSAGRLTERQTTKDISKRRVYIDREDATVYSVNTQYGGNTIGLKKLAMRLAIFRAVKEDWLTEHMLVMGVKGPGGRVTHFTGAFPSMCGKTSTAMIPWESMIGDDIAYLRKKDGKVRAVNVESGMFGIILGINPDDDPLIWEVLHSENEVIFSNILQGEDNRPWWDGMGVETPDVGWNHSGRWWPGKKDNAGKAVPISHKNARFTVALEALKNTDVRGLQDPDGVEVKGLIYGGRDSDTWVPVSQAFDWLHGIVTKAAGIESETTAATLGKEGVRKFNPMSNLDFVSVPMGQYIDANIQFGKDLANPPSIFGVNYFIKDREGNYLNDKTDKGVWLKWMERRVNGDAGAIKTPTGFIPLYADLKTLFKEVLDKDLTHDAYVKMFTLRIPENLAKVDRLTSIFQNRVKESPAIVFEVLEAERQRLLDTQKRLGDYVEPEKML